MGTLNGNCQTVVLNFHLQSEAVWLRVTENPTQTVLCCLKEWVCWHICMRCNLASNVPWFMLKSHYQELSPCYPFLGSTSPLLARFWNLTWLIGACQPLRDLNPGAKSKSLFPSIPRIIPESHQDSNGLGVLTTLPQPCGQGKYDSDWRSFAQTTEERANPDHIIQEWEGADPKQKSRQLSKVESSLRRKRANAQYTRHVNPPWDWT